MIANQTHLLRRAAIAAAAALGLLGASPLAAADPSKEACLDAHSRGQDAKDQGKLTLAKKLFLTCAQSSCPALVQGDCARFVDDLGRQQPTLGFVARDGDGHDLPDTTVYVDDVLVATRLDDGKAYDIDPGKRIVKFQHDGKDQVVTVVVGTGEKGRTISATFGAPTAPAGGLAKPLREPEPVRKEPVVRKPGGAKLLIGVGAVLAAGGAGLAVAGLVRVPDNCSVGTHECAAPPGDPSFDKASSAMSMANLGFISAGVGAAALVGGIIWYAKGGTTSKETSRVAVPWVAPGAAGFSVSGRL
jgi:hypothetical protein